MNTPNPRDPAPSPPLRPRVPRRRAGDDVNRIRAALNLHRAELADALGVHVATVIRWEHCGPGPIRAEGLPGLVLLALRDRVVVEGVRLEDERATGRYVAQCLLRHGRLEAAVELIRFADTRTLRRIVQVEDQDDE